MFHARRKYWLALLILALALSAGWLHATTAHPKDTTWGFAASAGQAEPCDVAAAALALAQCQASGASDCAVPVKDCGNSG
jgi:hypothetical protein